MSTALVKIKDHKFILSGSKTIYWENKQTLLISDLHLHNDYSETLRDFEAAVKEFKVKRIIILGDLFQAHTLVDVNSFEAFTKKINKKIILVLGNHDILETKFYLNLGINEVYKNFYEDMFAFTHKPVKEDQLFDIHGHLHPGISFKNIKLPVFYLRKLELCLPSFGGTTGKNLVEPNKSTKVFVIANDSVKRIS